MLTLLHSELYGNFYAYRIGRHPHIPEIAQAVETVGDASGAFTFVSHMLPVARGILVTCYIRVPGAQGARAATEQVHRLWQESYSQSPFMRVLGSAEDVQLSAVVGTNRCLLSAAADDYGDRVVVVSAIDNLLKGSAGQALENANLMVGYPRVWGHEGLG